jgi:cyclopropane fatty-acyl-phospholipid synthase-like methyltransferase
MTSEPQYNILKNKTVHHLGSMSGYTYDVDPKRLGFMLSRYKFVSKMLNGYEWVLEIGCGDGFGTKIVSQSVGHIMAIDFDEWFIQDAKSRNISSNIIFSQHDMTVQPKYVPDRLPKIFNGAYALDVLEHIKPEYENKFLGNVAMSIGKNGTFICGMPSKESQSYASDLSRQGHVNCKTEEELRSSLKNIFHNVFLFGMNDEVIHTGYGPMCHYRLAICTGAKL